MSLGSLKKQEAAAVRLQRRLSAGRWTLPLSAVLVSTTAASAINFVVIINCIVAEAKVAAPPGLGLQFLQSRLHVVGVHAAVVVRRKIVPLGRALGDVRQTTGGRVGQRIESGRLPEEKKKVPASVAWALASALAAVVVVLPMAQLHD